MNSVFRVADYQKNAISDEEAIEKCLADANALPERTIVFDGKDWMISKAVLLKSNTTVLIDNCKIKQVDEAFDNIFRGDNLEIDPENPNSGALSVSPIENIKILGKGNAVLEGPEKNRKRFHPVTGEEEEMLGDFFGWRTLQISLSRCDGFEVGNLIFTKTRCWAVSFDICKNGYVHDLVFDTHVKNGDGVDFRSGCHHCKVENISGITWDDTVACTALWYPGKALTYPKDCTYVTMEPTMNYCDRTAEEIDISDIEIKNVHTGGKHHGVIVLAANGAKCHDISITDVEEIGGEKREAAVKIYTGYGSNYHPGDISNVTVNQVIGRKSEQALFCNAQVKNVTLTDVFHENPLKKAINLEFPEGVTYQYTTPVKTEERHPLGVYATLGNC